MTAFQNFNLQLWLKNMLFMITGISDEPVEFVWQHITLLVALN